MIDLTSFWDWIINPSNASTISALSTVAIAGLTIFLAYDTRKTRIAVYEQAIRPLITLRIEEGDYYLENFGTGTAIHLKITLLDPTDIGDMGTIYGCYLTEYVKQKVKGNSHFNQTILSLAPNQKVSGSLFAHFQSYETGLKDKLEDNSLVYDHNHGIHIWDYQAEAIVEFENTDSKKYYTRSHFDLSQVKGSAIPPVQET